MSCCSLKAGTELLVAIRRLFLDYIHVTLSRQREDPGFSMSLRLENRTMHRRPSVSDVARTIYLSRASAR